MLCRNTYDQSYIDDCRSKIAVQVAAYDALTSTAPAAAVDAFAPVFFNNLVLVLENYFVHRSRTIEGKDGNALNEVRVLCTSMMSNDGLLAADRTIKLKRATSILGLQVGDEIKLSEEQFHKLSEAFFAEIESRFR